MPKKATPPALLELADLARSIADGRAVPPEFLALIRRADAGDAAALARLREAYAELPAIADHVSSLQYVAEREVLGAMGNGATETFAAQADRWRKRLAGDDPSPLERLLVNRVVLDWLHALRMEVLYQQKFNGSLSLAQGEFYAKQAERAQRRFLRSVTALAQVRRLLAPTLQVNIAERQVNVAGTVNAGSTGIGTREG